MTEWIISDTHFGHERIISFCTRPFDSAAHMDATMVKRWQGMVAPEDTVYHLGDVGYYRGSQEVKTRAELTAEIIAQLPGRKILILGNHDKSAEAMRKMGFDVVCENMVIRHMNRVLLLNHKPLPAKPTAYHPGYEPIDYVLHGHIHNSEPAHRAPHVGKGELVDIPEFNINCSVELHNYAPVSLSALLKRKFYQERMLMNNSSH